MTLALFSPQVGELLDQSHGRAIPSGEGLLFVSPTPPEVSTATGEEAPVSSGAGWTVTVILPGTSLSSVLFFEIRVHLFGSSARNGRAGGVCPRGAGSPGRRGCFSLQLQKKRGW